MFTKDNGQILKELHEMAFVQHATLTPNFVSKRYQVHISEALKLLEEFVKQHRKKDKLTVQYSVSGSDDCDDDSQIRLQRFSVIEESELKSYLDSAKFVQSTCDIYSVSIADQEAKSVLNFEQFIFEPNMNNLSKVQSLTYVPQRQIGTRPPFRLGVPSLKYDLFDGETTTATSELEEEEDEEEVKEVKEENEVKLEPELEPMDVDVEVAKPTAPKKKSCSKEETKRYKRIRLLDSDDEEEDVKMKENVQVKTEEEFKVTKLKEEKKEPERKSPRKSAPVEAKKNGIDQTKPKPAPRAVKKKATQPSIMSFFSKK